MIDRFAASQQSIAVLADALPGSASPRIWSRTPAGAMDDWESGENWVADVLGPVSKKVERRKYDGSIINKLLPSGFMGGRFTDVVADGVGHEVKVGRVALSAFVWLQLRKDKLLVDTGRLRGVHWHFMISNESGTVGPSRALLKKLDDLKIPYTIHVG